VGAGGNGNVIGFGQIISATNYYSPVPFKVPKPQASNVGVTIYDGAGNSAACSVYNSSGVWGNGYTASATNLTTNSFVFIGQPAINYYYIGFDWICVCEF
jgi:hypothetical protein